MQMSVTCRRGGAEDAMVAILERVQSKTEIKIEFIFNLNKVLFHV